jgi:predicted Fe-S protein YdhL (DUF1289 family)
MTQADRRSSWMETAEAGTSEAAPSLAASPCVRRCTLDTDDLCVGCGRTLGEILEWAAAPTQRKTKIRSAAAARLEQRRFRLQC